jgi:hypothetical protein
MSIFRSGVKLLACGIMMGAGFVGGCQSHEEQQETHRKEQQVKASDAFLPNDESRSIRQYVDAQAAAGAQADASLSSQHFTGGKLNSLGRERLKMMLQGSTPVVVYIGATDEATTNLRRSAIDDYLKETGAGPDVLVVKSGYNPRQSTPVTENISRLPRTEEPGTTSTGSTATSTGTGGGQSTSGANR